MMHDWTLNSVTVVWRSGELRISLQSPAGPIEVRAAGLRRLDMPRAFPWGQSVSINEVAGPTPLSGGGEQLVIEMQSGDRIEVVADAIELPNGQVLLARS